MSDLRTAAQQALEALDKLYLPGELERVNAAITALRAALAQQDEPVETVREPVAWLYEAGADRTLHWYKPPLCGTPLYAAPPQRKPLTDDEIFAIENDIPDDVVSDRHWTIWYARAIERAHGIVTCGDTKVRA